MSTGYSHSRSLYSPNELYVHCWMLFLFAKYLFICMGDLCFPSFQRTFIQKLFSGAVLYSRGQDQPFLLDIQRINLMYFSTSGINGSGTPLIFLRISLIKPLLNMMSSTHLDAWIRQRKAFRTNPYCDLFLSCTGAVMSTDVFGTGLDTSETAKFIRDFSRPP